MEYEEKFGVKVDLKIPKSVRVKLYEQWEGWKRGDGGPEGDVSCYTKLDFKPNLMTRYEHFALGSGIGLPPDPFIPLALQHEGAYLEAVINAREQEFPPIERYFGRIYTSIIEDFAKITGLDEFNHLLEAERPDIDTNGRIRIPKITGVYTKKDKRKIDFPEEVITKLQLPILRNDLKLWDGVIAREVFDFDKGYRIELVSIE